MLTRRDHVRRWCLTSMFWVHAWANLRRLAKAGLLPPLKGSL